MKVQTKTSIKHLKIDKANNMMFVVVAVACLVVVFSLLSAKALLGQSNFQHKVIKADNSAITDLKKNIDAAKALKTQYDVFESSDPNIIGGKGRPNAIESGQSDGDNARIVLDALPDEYDFPALTSSLEKIVYNDHSGVKSITGTDTSGQTNASSTAGGMSQAPSMGSGQTTTTTTTGGQSQAQTMAFSLTAKTDYGTSLTLIKDLERSIRPFDVTSLVINGSSSALNVTIKANTYYQSSVSLQIGHKEIKQ